TGPRRYSQERNGIQSGPAAESKLFRGVAEQIEVGEMSRRMLEKLTQAMFASVVVSICVTVASAQTRDANKCRGLIYGVKEVTKRAKVQGEPNFNSLYEAFGRGVHAHVTLDAVLCRSGRVTDIQVTKSVPPEVA